MSDLLAGDGWVEVDNLDNPNVRRTVEIITDQEGVFICLTDSFAEGCNSTRMNLTFDEAKFLFGRTLEFVEKEEKKA